MSSISLRRPSVGGDGLPLVRRTAVGRAVAEDPRWLVPLALAVYVLGTTWTWEFPNWQGIPFPPVWLGAAVATLVVWNRAGRAFGPVPVAAIVAVTAMLTTDVTLFWSQPLRDFVLYLKAGDAWLADAPVYATVPLVERPDDLSNYPFLYPPLTLPLFGALSAIPFLPAAGLWLVASLAAVLAGLRWIGIGWRWCLLFVAWPPVAQGLYVGNVAIPMFVLFAAAVTRPALLAIPPIFKLYSGVASLWLLRREHWRDLALGVAIVAGLALATLPVTGPGLWGAWVEGLLVYQDSQRLLPEFLYGFGLGRYVPLWLVAALAIVVTLLALLARERREQLSRLGVATVVASPSLFAHGWLVAVPALAGLRTVWFWLAFGLTACSPGPAWFLALLIVAASWYRPAMRRQPGDDAWHPLGPADRPWATAAPVAPAPAEDPRRAAPDDHAAREPERRPAPTPSS
jgi:hypothetical protein